MTNKFLIPAFIVIIGVVGIGAWMFGKKIPQAQNLPSSPPVIIVSTSTPSATTSSIPTATSTPRLKTYRNVEFGFEFQYPNDWIIRENSFGNYYSKFNVVVAPSSGQKVEFPVLINIVLPEFADRTYLSLDPATSTIIMAGASGIKYQYEFEGSPEIGIVLPLGQYKIILGTTAPYQNDFDRIVATFKFLK